jgi:Domain of unknown function (DUF4333)
MSRVVAPLLLAGALLAPLAGCGSAKTHTLDAASAAQAIARNLADSTGLPTPKVTCPKGIEVKPGATFDCTTVLDGQPLTVRASLTDSKGAFTVKPAAAIVIVAKAVNAIVTNVEQTTTKATVDCGARTVLVKAPGQTFLCRATAAGVTRAVTVTVTDIDGNVRYELAPAGSGTPTPSVPSTGSAGTSPPSTLIGGG